MKYLFIFIVLLFSIGFVSCDSGGESEHDIPGKLNGVCYEDGTCDEGFICNEDNICISDSETHESCTKDSCKEGQVCDENTGKCLGVPHVTSEGIYLAQSHETEENEYVFYTSPVLYGSKVYTRLFRTSSVNLDKPKAMKLNVYDLSGFDKDMKLDDLFYKNIYEQVGPNHTTRDFNQRYYSPVEVEGYLYFSTMPENEDVLSQNSFIKYDLENETEVYHVKKDMVFGEDKNTTADLARGYFLPFDNNSKMAIIEDCIVKVVNTSDGSVFKYGEYDYFGDGCSTTLQGSIPPVLYGDGFYFITSSEIYKIKILPDAQYVEYGKRNVSDDPDYFSKKLMDDFKALYDGNKNYKKLEPGGLKGDGLIFDGENIYLLAFLTYDVDGESFPYGDLYLINYDISLNLKSITLLDSDKHDMSNMTTQYQKYNNVLYFKYHGFNKEELCAFDLSNNKFVFRHELKHSRLVEDKPYMEYIITGDTIIIPEVEQGGVNEDDDYKYNIVFNILDINTGEVLKTLHHKSLYDFDPNNNKIEVRYSLNDENAAYFFAIKRFKKVYNNIIIKIDSPNNKVKKTRYRFDNSLTSVVK